MPNVPIEKLLKITQDLDVALKATLVAFSAALVPLLHEQAQNLALTGGNPMSPESAKQYADALQIDLKMPEGRLVIQLDPTQWFPNALEDGKGPWNMLDTHLKPGDTIKGRNGKPIQNGYRYKIIPIPAKRGAATNPRSGDNSKNIQDKIHTALAKPKWKAASQWATQNTPNGGVKRLSELVTKDPDISGLYKVEKFRDVTHMQSGKPPTSRGYVMFRVMTDNPKSGIGKWEHPGIQARKIFPQLKTWLDTKGDSIFNDILEDKLKKVLE